MACGDEPPTVTTLCLLLGVMARLPPTSLPNLIRAGVVDNLYETLIWCKIEVVVKNTQKFSTFTIRLTFSAGLIPSHIFWFLIFCHSVLCPMALFLIALTLFCWPCQVHGPNSRSWRFVAHYHAILCACNASWNTFVSIISSIIRGSFVTQTYIFPSLVVVK